MRKILVFMMCCSILVFALAGTSYAWQGRMAGAGDPYGLLQDESDFLIHPAKIAKGEGITFYGHYRFIYTDVMDWDYDRVVFTPAGVLISTNEYDISGDEYTHNVLVGAGFPLGPGRMGLFFSYDGKRGDYDGDYSFAPPGVDFATIEMENGLDAFALRLLYGLPLGGFNLGGEVQFAYRQEAQESFLLANDLTTQALWNEWRYGFCFIPYDSSYWETLFKGSLEGMVGPLDLEFTLRGGFIFSGDNDFDYAAQAPVGTLMQGFDLDGGVQGWQIGGDLWIRYPLGDSLTLPFLVRIDYQDKTRDGDGVGTGLAFTGALIDYEHEERSFGIEAGGGVDKELSEEVRIAAGIYYHYLQGINEVSYNTALGVILADETDTLPDFTEHRVVIRLAGEWELTPSVALRMGLEPFFGWARKELKQHAMNNVGGSMDFDMPMNGYHWGVGGSLGGTVQFDGFTMEPFFNIGYQGYDLSGDGERYLNGALSDLRDYDETRSEWYIGGGCSFLFNLP